MKKIISTSVLWLLYLLFGALLGWVSYEYLDQPILITALVAVAGFLLLAFVTEWLDRKFAPKPEVPSPEEFLNDNPDMKGARAIVREYVALGGDADEMREVLRSRSE